MNNWKEKYLKYKFKYEKLVGGGQKNITILQRQKNITIPQEQIKHFIGRKGNNIKKLISLARRFNIHINFNGDSGILVIIGDEQALEKFKSNYINQYTSVAPAPPESEFEISNASSFKLKHDESIFKPVAPAPPESEFEISKPLFSNLPKISIMTHNLGPQTILNKGFPAKIDSTNIPNMIVKERGHYKQNKNPKYQQSYDELIAKGLPMVDYQDIKPDFYLFQEWQYNLDNTEKDFGKRNNDLAFKLRDLRPESFVTNYRLITLPYNYEIINKQTQEKYNIYISNVHGIVFSDTSNFKSILTGLVIFDKILKMEQDFKYVIIGGDFNINLYDPNFLQDTIKFIRAASNNGSNSTAYLIKIYIDQIINKLTFLVRKIFENFIILPNVSHQASPGGQRIFRKQTAPGVPTYGVPSIYYAPITNYWSGSYDQGQGKSTCVDYYLISKELYNNNIEFTIDYRILNKYMTDGNPDKSHTLMENDFDHSPLLLELFFNNKLTINIIRNYKNRTFLERLVSSIKSREDFIDLFSYS